MKKAAKILFIVLTIVTGISILSSIIVLACLGLLSVATGTMQLILGILNVTHSKDIVTSNETIIFFIEAGLFYALALFVLPFTALVVCARAGIQFGLMLASVLKLNKAETKKQTLFPMVVSFVFAGLYLANGSYLYTALYALPGIFLAVDKDEAKPAEVEVKQ